VANILFTNPTPEIFMSEPGKCCFASNLAAAMIVAIVAGFLTKFFTQGSLSNK
jgi:hypothetical protein